MKKCMNDIRPEIPTQESFKFQSPKARILFQEELSVYSWSSTEGLCCLKDDSELGKDS